jgi:Holliday junction resolvasome RuvABC ATP-dependent DNA helicase subunit
MLMVKSLAEVLATLVNPLYRLNALVIVSLTTDQRAQIPASLVNNFDHSTVIKPLNEEEVKQLCESRIASASNISWDLSEEALGYIFEKTKGNPSKVMRLLRDLVDEERSNPRDVKYEEPSIDYEESKINISYPEEDKIVQEELNTQAIFDLDLDKLAEVPLPEKKTVSTTSFAFNGCIWPVSGKKQGE